MVGMISETVFRQGHRKQPPRPGTASGTWRSGPSLIATRAVDQLQDAVMPGVVVTEVCEANFAVALLAGVGAVSVLDVAPNWLPAQGIVAVLSHDSPPSLSSARSRRT